MFQIKLQRRTASSVWCPSQTSVQQFALEDFISEPFAAKSDFSRNRLILIFSFWKITKAHMITILIWRFISERAYNSSDPKCDQKKKAPAIKLKDKQRNISQMCCWPWTLWNHNVISLSVRRQSDQLKLKHQLGVCHHNSSCESVAGG